jgi:hypothetical protein
MLIENNDDVPDAADIRFVRAKVGPIYFKDHLDRDF